MRQYFSTNEEKNSQIKNIIYYINKLLINFKIIINNTNTILMHHAGEDYCMKLPTNLSFVIFPDLYCIMYDFVNFVN